jgi:carbon storage regulator
MSMLVLSRKPGEKLVIGGVTVTVAEAKGGQVRLAFEAPGDVPILRAELLRRDREEQDPDLAAKPAEWRGVDPGAVLRRWRARPSLSSAGNQ